MKSWGSMAAILATLAGLLELAPEDVAAQAKGDPKAGHVLYHARCANCHGANGAGDGRAAPTLADKPKNWTVGQGLKELSDEQVSDTIRKGGAAIVKSTSMPAYPKLTDAQVRDLVAYLRTLQP